jgi:hypothetical protein
MENVHGRELVEAGQLCERKNGRGVDPNRNWDIDWGKKEKDYDPNEEFPGRAPLRWGCSSSRAIAMCHSITIWCWLWVLDNF